MDLTPLGIPLVAHEDFLATLKGALVARGLGSYAIVSGVLKDTSGLKPTALQVAG